MSKRSYRIVILGGGGVGKSCLTIRFCFQKFTEKYDPTIEETYTSTIPIDGRRVNVEIMDTAGTEQFLALQSLYMKSGDGYILVFAVNSTESFQEINNIRAAILRERENNGQSVSGVPMVLVGNKADLVEDRAVPREVGKAMANHFGMPYIEASAKRGINVDETFEKIMRLILLEEQRYMNNYGTNGGGGLNGSVNVGGRGGRKNSRTGKGGKNSQCVIC